MTHIRRQVKNKSRRLQKYIFEKRKIDKAKNVRVFILLVVEFFLHRIYDWGSYVRFGQIFIKSEEFFFLFFPLKISSQVSMIARSLIWGFRSFPLHALTISEDFNRSICFFAIVKIEENHFSRRNFHYGSLQLCKSFFGSLFFINL